MIAEIGRFLSMVVLLFNMCNQTNFTRKQCLTNWDEWLYPALREAWEIKTRQVIPYQTEKEALQSKD